MMMNTLPIILGAAMTMLKVWPLPDDDLPLHQSHLIVTFGPPIVKNLGAEGCKNVLNERLHWKVGLSTVQIIV
jgi:hypothetical protein